MKIPKQHARRLEKAGNKVGAEVDRLLKKHGVTPTRSIIEGAKLIVACEVARILYEKIAEDTPHEKAMAPMREQLHAALREFVHPSITLAFAASRGIKPEETTPEAWKALSEEAFEEFRTVLEPQMVEVHKIVDECEAMVFAAQMANGSSPEVH